MLDGYWLAMGIIIKQKNINGIFDIILENVISSETIIYGR